MDTLADRIFLARFSGKQLAYPTENELRFQSFLVGRTSMMKFFAACDVVKYIQDPSQSDNEG
jgi:hypothetical protein